MKVIHLLNTEVKGDFCMDECWLTSSMQLQKFKLQISLNYTDKMFLEVLFMVLVVVTWLGSTLGGAEYFFTPFPTIRIILTSHPQ